jgi:hypothetical protein
MAEVLTTEDQTPEKVMESLSGFTALQRFLACRAVQQVETPDGEWLDVTLDYEEADLFPEDDLAMVAEIVQRLRVHDAAGVTLGVEPIERWATFREEHECAENCAACTRVINAISSIHLDEV